MFLETIMTELILMVKTQTVPAVGPCFTNRNFKEKRISKDFKEITNAKIKGKNYILLV